MSKNKKTKLIQLSLLLLVPQTLQFSNSFYENLSQLYNLKGLLESEGIYLNDTKTPNTIDLEQHSYLPLGNRTLSKEGRPQNPTYLK